MSLHLGTLYHWSPRKCREAILREGLQIATQTWDGDRFAEGHWRVCLGTTPSSAWGLILNAEERDETWDLWQVTVQDGDQARIRGDHLPNVREVQLNHGLGPDRIWWVGSREV